MWRIFVASLAVVIGTDVQASAALFAATNPAFGSRLQDRAAIRNSSGPVLHRNELTEGHLYFSITIVGDDSTLKYLKDKEHLPLHVTFWGDNSRFDTVDIGITQEKWMEIGDVLVSEFNDRGVFTFRTYYRTKKIEYRNIELTLTDAFGNTIRTVSGSQNINPQIELEQRR